MQNKEKILVHMCCAPCAAPSGEKLMLHGYEVVLYFSNSNIYPHDEYLKRKESGQNLADIWQVEFHEDEYDHNGWTEKIKGFETEPEKGKRCERCFEHSLARTAKAAAEMNIKYFTTTLTLSPHKVSKMIFEIGKKFPGYQPFDFKKENGFLRSLELSKKWDLYRQFYCGCEFSLEAALKRNNLSEKIPPEK